MRPKDLIGACSSRVITGRSVRALVVTASLVCATSTLAANNDQGTWSSVFSWPLIPLHSVVTPEGRLMSYGTRGNGQQTGFFIYDIWDPSMGTGISAHTTLPNGTGTDIFCSSQLIIPGGGPVPITGSGKIFLSGGDNWTGTGTTNTGNSNTNVFDPQSNTLTRGTDMNRARWYGTSTVLLNGEIYIQGGSGGEDRPEVRKTDGTFRLLTTANT